METDHRRKAKSALLSAFSKSHKDNSSLEYRTQNMFLSRRYLIFKNIKLIPKNITYSLIFEGMLLIVLNSTDIL